MSTTHFWGEIALLESLFIQHTFCLIPYQSCTVQP